jgi:hypothetical protein
MPRAPLVQAALTVMFVRSTIRTRATLACALTAILAVPAGAGRAAAAPAAGPASVQEDALWTRLRRIESAFRAGDAAALRASFPSTSRLRVDLPDVPGCPASYGPGQLQVIFGQIFAEAATREFAFARADVTQPSAGTAFARGRWVRGDAGAGERADVVTFTLREEAGDWRIHEILAVR